VFRFADNNMVKQDQLHQLAGIQQIARGGVVARGRLRNTGRVVMNQHHGGGGEMQRRLNDTADINCGLGGCALRDILLAQDLVLSVQEDGDDGFLTQPGKSRPETVGNGL